MTNLPSLLAAGVIGYLLYDKYFYRQQSEVVNAIVAPSPPAPGAPAGSPRGIRNNNPGNIKWSAANNWQGQIGKDSAGFVIFSSADYGLRAAARLIKTYINTYKLDTLAKIAPRWSPDAVGLSGAYAAGASRMGQIGANVVISPANAAQIAAVLRGIVGQENGEKWISHFPPAMYTAASTA